MAESWFLKIDGVDGESTDSAHKGEIDVLSWGWGVTRAAGASGSGGGSGAGAGKAVFEDFEFVARISKASPKLVLSAAAGTHHKWAALTGRRGNKSKGIEYLKYKLSDVLISSVQQSGGDDTDAIEEFSLAYAKFEMDYTSQSKSGKAGQVDHVGWDVKSNKKF